MGAVLGQDGWLTWKEVGYHQDVLTSQHLAKGCQQMSLMMLILCLIDRHLGQSCIQHFEHRYDKQ